MPARFSRPLQLRLSDETSVFRERESHDFLQTGPVVLLSGRRCHSYRLSVRLEKDRCGTTRWASETKRHRPPSGDRRATAPPPPGSFFPLTQAFHPRPAQWTKTKTSPSQTSLPIGVDYPITKGVGCEAFACLVSTSLHSAGHSHSGQRKQLRLRTFLRFRSPK